MVYERGTSRLKGVVMKLLYLFFIWMCAAHAFEIDPEDNLNVTTLSNGIELWIRPYMKGNSKISCRVVAKNPSEDLQQIFSLDCAKERFESELSKFIDYCKNSIQKESKVACIVVGNFNKKLVKDALTETFDTFNKRQIAVYPRILVTPSISNDHVCLSLYYPASLQELKTDKDLKTVLTLHLTQMMVQERFRLIAAEVQGELIEPTETSYMLPYTHTVARGQHSVQPDPARMLIGFLSVIQDLRESSFKENELTQVKNRLSKTISSLYQQNPTSGDLADYYVSHFAFGLGCPSYKSFMTAAIQIIPTIEMTDIEENFCNFFDDEKRRVVIRLPTGLDLSEGSIRDVLQTFKLGGSLDDNGKNGQKDTYALIPIKEEQAQIIYDIIETVAKNNVLQLGLKKSELEKKRKKIDDVHPLRFLGTIFSNPYLRQRCMPKIQDSIFKWRAFLGGLSGTMDREYDRNNLMSHIPGFCKVVKADEESVRHYLQKKEWEKLVKYLIKSN